MSHRRQSSWVAIAALYMATVALAVSLVFYLKLAQVNDQFCAVSVAQRHALDQQWRNTREYLKSPAGHEKNGLNDFIKRISVPQLKQRRKTETVPDKCEE